MTEDKISDSNKCTCIHCRCKEIGIAYWMHEYTYITDRIYTLKELVENNIPNYGLEAKGLSEFRAVLECNIDEALSCILENSEVIDGFTFIQALDKWKLKDNFNEAIIIYNKLTNK